MAESRRNKRKKRALNTLLEKGILATGLGIVFLAAPLVVKAPAILVAIASGLRMAGWAALGIGVVLLGIHYATNAKMSAVALAPNDASEKLPRKQQMPKEPVTIGDGVSGIRSAAKTITTPDRIDPTFTSEPLQTPSNWSPAVFAAIEWRRFEAVCEALFAQAGFQTRSQSHGADGGVDIWLHSGNAQGPVSVVQCKHWQSKPVGVKEMREFFGVMSSHQLKRGSYATSSTFTADAQQFAQANGIHTLDGPALLALIDKRSHSQQQALLAVALKGDYWRPTCASCGIKLVERTPAKSGAAFWGCSNYPRCKSTFKMTASIS